MSLVFLFDRVEWLMRLFGPNRLTLKSHTDRVSVFLGLVGYPVNSQLSFLFLILNIPGGSPDFSYQQYLGVDIDAVA